MNSWILRTLLCYSFFSIALPGVNAQPQEDFSSKLTDIYTTAATDKKKGLTLAKELYNTVEKN